ncbi:MAG: hypothetical protein ACPGMR_03260 [Pontibacterium sp.]
MTLDDLIDWVAPEVAGAMKATIRSQLVLTMRELCDNANVWLERIDVYVPKGLQEAELDAPENGEVLRVVSVDNMREGDYEQPVPHAIRFAQKATEARRHSVSVACRPVLTAKELPTALERWAEALMFGALYRLMRMPDQKWSNPALSSHYQTLYFAQQSEAARLGNVGHHKAVRQVKRRPFV